MRTPAKLAVYGLSLVVVFGTALGAGSVVGPSREPAASGAAHDATAPDGAGHAGTTDNPADDGSHPDDGDTHTDDGADAGTATDTGLPGGLQVSEGGFRLAPETAALTPGASTEFRFRILGPDGAPVTGYTPTHERDLHLIVIRRDLTGFQHLHPARAADGLWSIPLTVADAGQYRVFADFQPSGRDKPLTLGIDVPAAGPYQPTPRGQHSHDTEVDGYRVELVGHLEAGTASRLTLRISRNGKPVTDLQPYLGALGHLVALRDGDLAYLHVHPDSGRGAGPEVSFTVEVPSAGTYGLFLDFRHGDTVHTATFTASTS
jgi:hypothetical protein